MLRIIYKTSIYSYPYVGNDNSFSGQIASFVGNRSVMVCTDKMIPAGFFITDFDGIYNIWHTHATIAVGQSELVTDKFEPSKYKVNDFLYCSENGKVSNESRYRGNIIVGLVNSFTPTEIGFITMFARGLENPITPVSSCANDKRSI